MTTTLGKRIAQARRELGVRRQVDISQSDLATLVEVSAATVSRWEADLKKPGDESLERLAELFGVPRAWLRYGEGPKDLPAAAAIPPEYLVTNREGHQDGMAGARELEARREAERKVEAAKRRKRGA